MSEHYRYRIQKVFLGHGRGFQLRVGMDGERDLEFIPVYQTAFAMRLSLKESHPTEAEARLEKDHLVEWLRQQTTHAAVAP